MAIKEEFKSLLKQASALEVSIEGTTKKKKEFEASINNELNALELGRQAVERELFSLGDRGILYCRKCNDLYELSDARLERKEGEVVVGSEPYDYDRWRDIYAYGVELKYYCPKCDILLNRETRTS